MSKDKNKISSDAESSKEATTTKTELNLGLSEILESEPGLDLGKHLNRLARRRGFDDEKEDKSSGTESDSKVMLFNEMAKEQRWQELLVICDRELSKKLDSDNTEAELNEKFYRLWWLKGQLELGQVPIGILSAPLDSVTRDLAECDSEAFSPEQEKLFAELKPFAAELLSQVARLLGFEKEGPLAITFIERAAKLDKKFEEELYEAANQILGKLKEVPAYKQSKEDKRFIDYLKETKQSTEPKTSEIIPDGTERKNRSVKAKTLQQEQPKEGEGSAQKRPLKLFGGAIILVCLCIYFLFFSAKELQHAPEETIAAGREPALSTPPFNRLRSLGHLDALLQQINKVESTDTASVEKQDLPKKEEQRELVNTEQPIEPPELKAIFSSENISKEAKEHRVIDKDFVKGFPGTGDPGVKAYFVKRFKEPKQYELLVDTKVMARPSFRAPVLVSIQAGKRVQVIEQLGPWLKLRSSKGQLGYILAQDAGEIS